MNEVCITTGRIAVAAVVSMCLIAASYYLGQWKAAKEFTNASFKRLVEDLKNV